MFERLTALFGLKRAPPPALVAASLCHDPDNAPRNATGGQAQNTHFLSCLSRLPMLAPREASVRAFLEWLQELEEAGVEWEQSELLRDYQAICDMAHLTQVMPGKWFWRALEANGCTRRQAELTVDGRRWRPYMVTIPKTLSKFGTNATFPNGKKAVETRVVSAKSSRSGLRVVNSSGIPMGAKGPRHRADIGLAVAS